MAVLLTGGGHVVFAQVDAEQVTVIGRNVLAMDDYLLSIQYFNLAIKAKPYLSDPYYYRAVAKLMLDDFRGAEEDCTAAIERNRFKYEAYRVRGFSRLRLGADSAAVADFNVGLSYLPDDRYFLYYKAIAQTEEEQYAAADSTFRLLRRYHPKFEDGLAAHSRMLLAEGDTAAALQAADDALAISRNLLHPYLVKAEILSAKSEWAEAADALTEAMRLEPRETSLYINRAFMRYNADDLFGAMADYNYALELDPDNRAATYNRALLRMQVQDLPNALTDFTKILEWDPDNFPARYNRVLINYDFGNYNAAIADLRRILAKYPRFYQGYYALSDIYGRMGNERLSFENFHKANDIATRYVKNPKRYSLDRPSIEPGKSLAMKDEESAPGISEEEMGGDLSSQINRLITISTSAPDASDAAAPGKRNDLKGRVQDRELRAEPQPLYALTFTDNPSELRSLSNFFRDLALINTAPGNRHPIFLSNESGTQSGEEQLRDLFSLVEELNNTENLSASQLLARGTAQTILKNYDAALADLNASIKANPQFAAPLFQRAFTTLAANEAREKLENAPEDGTVKKADPTLSAQNSSMAYRSAIEDFDAALRVDPRLAYAWYNKGCVYYALRQYTDALECYNRAIDINPDFGNAWYNRALTYLRLDNKAEAAANLSKAGELGVLPAYNALKRISSN